MDFSLELALKKTTFFSKTFYVFLSLNNLLDEKKTANIWTFSKVT